MTRARRRLACERGDALIEGLFAFALVLLVVGVAAQALAYAHAPLGRRCGRAGRGPRRRGWRFPGGCRARELILAAAGGTGAICAPPRVRTATR